WTAFVDHHLIWMRAHHSHQEMRRVVRSALSSPDSLHATAALQTDYDHAGQGSRRPDIEPCHIVVAIIVFRAASAQAEKRLLARPKYPSARSAPTAAEPGRLLHPASD